MQLFGQDDLQRLRRKHGPHQSQNFDVSGRVHQQLDIFGEKGGSMLVCYLHLCHFGLMAHVL